MTKQTNARKIILAAGFLIVLLSVAVLPAMAIIFPNYPKDLRITDDRLTYLDNNNNWGIWGSSGGFTINYLIWKTPGLQFAHQKEYDVGTKKCYECAQPGGGYWGDCTSFVEAATAPNNAARNLWLTKDFKKGRNVMNFNPWNCLPGYDVSPGTVIASYPPNAQEDTTCISGHHAAVFSGWYGEYATLSNGQKSNFFITKGFWVYDQSYLPDGNGGHYPIIIKHLIMAKTGTLIDKDNTDARNYYVVKMPS